MRKIVTRKSEAASMMDDFLGDPPKQKKRTPARATREQHIEEVKQRWASKDWEGMTSGKLVALYWVCHEKVYAVAPIELDKGPVWQRAMMAAGKMVTEHFDGDVQRAVTFMRWVWTKENDTQEWRLRTKQEHAKRITWHRMFYQDYLITDWRAAAARRR